MRSCPPLRQCDRQSPPCANMTDNADATKMGISIECDCRRRTVVADALVGSGVRVLVVRPGKVRTRMSADSPDAPLTCDKEDVAAAVATHLTRGPTTIWVPAPLQFFMSGLRHLPRPVFRKVAERRN